MESAMSVIENVAVAEALLEDVEIGATGLRQRSPEKYRQLWQQLYDEALAGGASPNGARFIAGERLVRIQAEDAQVEPPGVGNALSY
jgi:hypothetical protein